MEQFGVISADHGGGKRRAGIALAGCTSASAFTLHRFYRDGIYTFLLRILTRTFPNFLTVARLSVRDET
jgi:hypothetical protein